MAFFFMGGRMYSRFLKSICHMGSLFILGILTSVMLAGCGEANTAEPTDGGSASLCGNGIVDLMTRISKDAGALRK